MRGVGEPSARARFAGALVSCSLITIPSALAEDSDDPLWRQLVGAEIAAVFEGETLEGTYSDGRWWSEEIRKDGTTHYREDGIVSFGRYNIDGPRVCFQYPEPIISEACFTVWRRSQNCYDVYDADHGDPTAPFWQRVAGIGWDARFWRTSEPSTCAAAALS